MNKPEKDNNNSLNAHSVSTLLGSNNNISSSHIDVNIGGALTEKSKIIDKIRSSGRVSINIYQSYLSANGNVFNVFFVLFSFIFTQVLNSGSDCWISFWYFDN